MLARQAGDQRATDRLLDDLDEVQECLVVPTLRSPDERPRLEVTLNVEADPIVGGRCCHCRVVLHPVSFLVFHLELLDAVAYLMVAGGLTLAARPVLATPNDEWDLASERPAPRARLKS